jgi:chromate transporter
MRVRNYIFLKDVFVLAFSAIGGPQAHIAMMFELMVNKRKYLTEAELLELNALCNILPGPTSTQTITAIGFKIGKAWLAYLTLMVWVLPAILIMTFAAIGINYLQSQQIDLSFLKFVQPIAVGFVAYAAYSISTKVVNSKTAVSIMVVSAILSFFLRNPLAFPVILILSGAVTALKFKREKRIEDKPALKIEWANFFLFVGVFLAAAILGEIYAWRPIRLFENFYRNGSLIFGGGQVLIPVMYNEFVVFKKYLSSNEFLSGYAIAQAVPGPVFSFSSFIGALSMRNEGIYMQLLGAFTSAAGIFLPGTFLIFFVIRFWDRLKSYRIVRASLEGINAASAGMVLSACFLLFEPVKGTFVNYGIIIVTFLLLQYGKLPSPLIILIGLVAGFLIKSSGFEF